MKIPLRPMENANKYVSGILLVSHFMSFRLLPQNFLSYWPWKITNSVMFQSRYLLKIKISLTNCQASEIVCTSKDQRPLNNGYWKVRNFYYQETAINWYTDFLLLSYLSLWKLSEALHDLISFSLQKLHFSKLILCCTFYSIPEDAMSFPFSQSTFNSMDIILKPKFHLSY